MLRRALLVCGILSSLLYIVTDLSAAFRYDGYSFFSQAASELAALGAPTRPVVVPLFLAYGALALAVGVGVVRDGADEQNRPVRLAVLLLVVCAPVDCTGC